MRTFNKFKEILAEKDDYITPQSQPAAISPAIKLYSALVRVILYSNKMVRQGIYDDFNWVAASLDLLHSFEKAGLRCHISGMMNFSKHKGPVVFIGNHMSTYETLVLPAIIHPVKRAVFITKKQLTDYPFFGKVNAARDPIIVGRENPREDLKQVLEEGRKRIEAGKSIIIFPQKTRSKYFVIKEFNSLGIKLAKTNKVPVVPFALLTDAWDNGKHIKELGKIDPTKKIFIEFGKAFDVAERAGDSHQRVIDFITSRLIKWGRREYIQ